MMNERIHKKTRRNFFVISCHWIAEVRARKCGETRIEPLKAMSFSRLFHRSHFHINSDIGLKL